MSSPQANMVRKSIIHVLYDFSASGAHIFVVNLANEQIKNYDVTLVNMNMNPNSKPDPVLINRIHPQVKTANLRMPRWIKGPLYRIGNFFTGMEMHNPLYAGLIAIKLMQLFKSADIVHTHFVRDRYLVSKALKLLNKSAPKHILTDHGGFLELENTYGKIGKYPRKYSQKVFRAIFNSCSYIATISEQQNAFWQKRKLEGYSIQYNKILNGICFEPKRPANRIEMGYTDQDFVFAMLARGSEPTKGWEVTINAFLTYNNPDARLLLIGGGCEVERLKVLHGNNPKISFTGAIENPADLITIADVGVLASTFSGESLPNSIIEFFKAGKPVIGSNVGEIKTMLQIGKDEAGILLSVQQNQIDPAEYAAAMQKMQSDKQMYGFFRKNAIKAGQQYDMTYCAYRYAKEAYCFDIQ